MSTRPDISSEMRHDLILPSLVRKPTTSRPKACVLLLHGVGGNETNLLEFSAALASDVLVVLPRGPQQLAASQYGWFHVDFCADWPKINATEAEASRQILLDFITQIENSYGLTPGDILIAGFSQGGIMSASVALSEPERIKGFAILSGRILPEIAPQLANRQRLATLHAFISHGELDNVLPVSWAQRSEQWLNDLGIPLATHRYPVGHTLTTATQTDFVAWVNKLIATPSAEETLLRARHAAICTEQAGHTVATLLHIGAHNTWIITGQSGNSPQLFKLAIGTESTALHYFRHEPPTPGEIENAIQIVEDAIMPIHAGLTRPARLFTTDIGIREIAQLAGLSDQSAMIMDLETMERVFNRLAAVIEGQPATQAGIPANRFFAARLLILREIMHHLQFAAISIRV